MGLLPFEQETSRRMLLVAASAFASLVKKTFAEAAVAPRARIDMEEDQVTLGRPLGLSFVFC